MTNDRDVARSPGVNTVVSAGNVVVHVGRNVCGKAANQKLERSIDSGDP
jgi:K+/H+ antiporter YhaU regulatory subunit KhtT